ncbi:efflux transporter, outer membrane factor (OMF) lipoprotein, NodT family [Duganella sp. CF402]|uniref:efflux transporter outer membrane subunit n=1 Tax=unclassified Duganella TaxID=2636909 RepID=UPI0008C164FD|nr:MULTISPECIES: efflux transporter outer membrane subunit [unclassified Duganella]RZT04527.1 NodT family efflux transporter outer membrane factor (OMF) lipoprotein [Duganella sp. BK701]SEM33282.1 efflux transporter, outer membrane factor (OMF) lipoprotein, NodT family [Duganella sp. CF402]
MKKRASATVVIATVLLAACADMGKVQPQAVQLKSTELHPGKALSAASANVAWPDEHWWEALHDAQLNQLVNTALSDNPSLRATLARVRQAEALAGVAKAATLPRVDASASADRELYSAHSTIPAPLAGNYAWKNTATLSGSYDLDLWGRNRDALAAALDEVHMAAAESQMARLTLETSIVRSYIQLSLAYALQDSVADNLAQRQRILEITRRRKAAGLASDIEVTSIETTLPAGRREHEQYGETIALLRNQLAALIGKGPGDGDTIARPMLALQAGAHDAVPASLPAELVGRRPDIVAQRWRVEAAGARIEGAKKDFYPNLNLAAFVGMQSLGFGHFLEAGSQMRGITPAISLPVFEGGRLRSQLSNQTAIYDGAVEQYNATVIQAMSDVANAVVKMASVRQQDQLAQRALESAKRQQQLAERAYQAGLTDTLNVINAQLTLLNEQQQMAQVASKQLDNFALLMSALGGGIKLDSH